MRKVLFLCTQNSARSQIAEAILNSKGNGEFIAYSAGSCPAKDVNPYALLAMQELGIDITNYETKSVDNFLDEEFDFVITLCDKMRNQCPNISSDTIQAHWGLPDPKYFEGTDEEILKQYKRLKNDLITRVNILLSLPMEKLDRASIKEKLDNILKDEYGKECCK
ncbi:arsenate reductase ArsC [Clostridium sp. YIM B02506]|uniref:arsenate reductase ArsC n=1 Tax=Clostridium sp. YIM B02506 TaxID=2910680 RepID=UPI001EEED365|nr:arsenate reductase ArsC [Clostridium sp. YIM B02506]